MGCAASWQREKKGALMDALFLRLEQPRNNGDHQGQMVQVAPQAKAIRRTARLADFEGE